MRIVALIAVLAGAALVFLLREDDEPAHRDAAITFESEPGAATLGAAGSRRVASDDAPAAALLAELTQAPDTAAKIQILSRRGGARMPFSRALIERLVAWLASDDPKLRWQAAFALSVMDARAGPYLVPLLGHEDTGVRRVALYVLFAWMQRGQDTPPVDFLPLLEDADAGVKSMTLNALMQGVPYEPELAARLLALTRSGRGSPWMAGSALALMGPQGIELLRPLLSDEDAGRRVLGLRALVRAPRDHLHVLLPDLVRTLGDPDDSVRLATLALLQRLEGACVPCLPGLLELLEDESEDGALALRSIEVLALMGPAAHAAVPALIEYLRSPDEHMVVRAAAALGAIGSHPEAVLPALQALIQVEGSDAAAKAMAAYGRAGYEYACELFRGEDPDARHAALLVFAEQGPAAARIVPELIPLLGGEDVWLRERSIRTLAAIGPAAAAAVPALMKELLQGPEDTSPQFLGSTLSNMGVRGERALRDAMRSTQKRDRLRALGALGAFRGRTAFALDEIEPLLEDKDGHVRVLARAALLVGLEYPDGFGQAPTGVDDSKLRARVREELRGMVADSDDSMRYIQHTWWSPQRLLDALDEPRQ